ncbi:MAG: glycosyltransferase family 2 protein [Eubacteriales bacterium]
MTETVAAIVVTYNRKKLLLECLNAIIAQACPVNKIILIDNASTDGTTELLKEKGFFDNFLIDYVKMPENTGGAGGFHEGVKRGYEGGYEWLWLMDDDTIATSTALSFLLDALRKFENEQSPVILASKVIWKDGSIHPMNMPTIKVSDSELLLNAAEKKVVSIRSTSFVSLLLHRHCIEYYGLPIADYFIWNDDVEFTARILKNGFGVLVPSSVVVHKTLIKYMSVNETGARYYYEVRNKLWMLIKSDAWCKKEKIKLFIRVLINTWHYLRKNHFDLKSIRTVSTGFWDGITKKPAKIAQSNKKRILF